MVAWELKTKDGDEIIYTEEIVAQILKFGRQLSERQANSSIKDCVITIPSYITTA